MGLVEINLDGSRRERDSCVVRKNVCVSLAPRVTNKKKVEELTTAGSARQCLVSWAKRVKSRPAVERELEKNMSTDNALESEGNEPCNVSTSVSDSSASSSAAPRKLIRRVTFSPDEPKVFVFDSDEDSDLNDEEHIEKEPTQVVPRPTPTSPVEEMVIKAVLAPFSLARPGQKPVSRKPDEAKLKRNRRRRR